jgi:uncharacterized protein (DUF1684 family)
MNELDKIRRDKDQFFLNERQSPLTREQKRTFTGLNYFPENPALRLDLKLERINNYQTVTLATSTGDEREYTHVGQVSFDVNGQQAALQVYEADYGFFLPFSDATAPDETYGAGRYLEPEEITSDILHVDFNLAYNPYCAYNEQWSCPLPPSANRLKVRIEAGEKKFHE